MLRVFERELLAEAKTEEKSELVVRIYGLDY